MKRYELLHGALGTPPLSEAARVEAGRLIRRLQRGLFIGMPSSRPMPSIGQHVHELRINDEHQTWRIIYRIDSDAIVVADVFSKKTPSTPIQIIRNCQERLNRYDEEHK